MTAPARARSLVMIRVAMIVGIVAFAVIVFTLKRSGGLVSSAPVATLNALHMATWIAAAASAAALVILRVQLGAATPDRRVTLTILAWAIGEFAALFGLAFYMLSGNESAAAPGLLAFATAMILFPVAARES